jgi:hypothetical protein
MAVVAPVTGTRATGKVLVTPNGTSQTIIKRNQVMYPIINGDARETLLFKVAEGPEDDGSWIVNPGGSSVDVFSLLGGKRHNLPTGMKFRLDPLPGEAVNPIVELQSATTDGADPVHFGGVMSVVQFETLGAASLDIDTFRSNVGQMPALIIVWDGSEPADGTTQSSIQRGRTRVGTRLQLWKERFNVFVITKRVDSDHMRRYEGLQILDDITGWLTDRQAVDGQVFSAPTGIQCRGRRRIAGLGQPFQQLYVYVLELSVTRSLKMTDTRVWNDWLRTHNEFLTFEKDGQGDRIVIVDQDIDMRP